MNNNRRILLTNASIATAEEVRQGALLIEDGTIGEVWKTDGNGLVNYEGGNIGLADLAGRLMALHPDMEIRDLSGKTLMAGGIDAHVHFREPGMTAKADIESESRAALLGGVTSFIDMPNTNPPTVSIGHLEEKCALAEGRAFANYGFHIGTTNGNADDLRQLLADGRGNEFCGIKVFMGSSTGNMLVDSEKTLTEIFSISDKRILVHSEDESIIRSNLAAAKEKYGDDIPMCEHENIRSRIACIRCTVKALEMAMNAGTKLHVTHVTTAEEIEMIRTAKQYNPEISAETSANYLSFCDEDYDTMGSRLKCNPAVKTAADMTGLRQALKDGIIDSIGSDHAPHLKEEKLRPYTTCPSGVPSIQQSIAAILTVASEEDIPLTRVASAISERPAELFGIHGRGKIQKGYAADLIVIDTEREFTVGDGSGGPAGIDYKCGWSPYEGKRLKGFVEDVYLNGRLAVCNGRLVDDTPCGVRLSF